MSTRLKVKDHPEPWFPPKKSGGRTSRQKSAMTENDAEEDATDHIVVEETQKRGRGRLRSNKKIVAAKKGKRKGKTLRSSAVDVVLGCSKSHVPDPIELRERREADAAACGRQIRTVFEPVEVESNVAPTAVIAGQFDSHIGLGPAELVSSRPKTSAFAETTADEDFIQRDERARASCIELDSEQAAPFYRRPGKEPISVDFHESTPGLAGVRSNVPHDWRPVEMDTDMQSKERSPRLGTRHRSLRGSATEEIYEDPCGQRLPQRANSPEDGRTSQQRSTFESSRRSPGTLLQTVGAVDGVLLGAQVNGVKPVSRGVSKDYQNITRKMHMRTLFIMSTGGPRIHTTGTEEVVVAMSLSLWRGTTGK